jgi:hypothetical protein
VRAACRGRGAGPGARDCLASHDFAQIAEAEIGLGDLTVLVGAQGTGKSLVLQWLKCALDGRQILKALQDAGHPTADRQVTIDLVFGTGMGEAWCDGSSIVRLDGKEVIPEQLGRRGNGQAHLFYIPAHRSMLISDGWASPFQKLSSDVPVVARIFSQNLFDRFRARGEGPLFPLPRLLKAEYRKQIDAAIFHGGTVGIEEDRQHAKRLRLTHGATHLPFMTWTAGQREFAPLLLGLYHLLPQRKQNKHPDLDWVVIEEPEMGLHPQAVAVVLLLVLDLLWRGYRVAISTHSPDVLTAVWMLQRLKENRGRPQLVCEAFGVDPSQQMLRLARAALKKEYRVHELAFGAGDKVHAQDISRLDADSESDREAFWGGLTAFSSRFGDAVRKAVNGRGL